MNIKAKFQIQSPGVFLMEQDAGNAAILPKACEVRAPNAERAAHLLDAALSNRHVDAHGKLRILSLPLTFINIQLTIFKGRRECVGSVRCVSSLLVHISAASVHFQETLATVQLASRVHRLRRKRIKAHVGGSGSGGSSEESKSGRSSRGTITETGSSSVDPSSSEQSCDTVIYVGPGGDDATDGEHPPVYLPPINSGDNRCSMKKALRGSSVDSTSKNQEGQRTPKKSSKTSVSSKSSKSPKNSSHKDSSPQRGKDGVVKSASGEINCTVNGHNDTVKNISNVNSGTSARTSSKHINSSVVIKLCSGATPKSPKSPHISRHKSHKNQPNAHQTPDCSGATEVSDEQWIDGPRVSKSKIFEGHKVKSYELETWIDGPEATYGYMDDHKKNMIQKWVETQNNNVPNKANGTPSKTNKHTYYKELTQFKTVDDEEVSPKHKEKHKDKRRSSDAKDLKKEHKSHHITSKEKDSPHRRKSYTEKSNSHQEYDTNKTKQQSSLNNSTPTKPSTYYSKDSVGVSESPVNTHTATPEHQPQGPPNLRRSNSLNHGKTEALSKQAILSNSHNRSSTPSSSILNDNIEEKRGSKNDHKYTNGERESEASPETVNLVSLTKENQIIDGKSDKKERKLRTEEEDVLQIIYIQTEEGNVDTKIQQTLSQ
ncbi:Kinesin-like protein, partial [Armadillidium vulgare]